MTTTAHTPDNPPIRDAAVAASRIAAELGSQSNWDNPSETLGIIADILHTHGGFRHPGDTINTDYYRHQQSSLYGVHDDEWDEDTEEELPAPVPAVAAPAPHPNCRAVAHAREAARTAVAEVAFKVVEQAPMMFIADEGTRRLTAELQIRELEELGWTPPSPKLDPKHQCELWQERLRPDGGYYCAGCGADK